MLRRLNRSTSQPVNRANARSAFTLIELLVVIGIIALVAAFLLPTLGPSTGRALDGATRQFVADLEGARLTAIAQRTRTRVLIPIAAVAGAPGDNLALRGYLIASLDRTTATWQPRGKWNRLSQSVAFDPTLPDSTTPPLTSILKQTASSTPVQGMGTISAPSIEFLSNGSTSLDPTTPPQILAIADAIVQPDGSYVAKNTKLRFNVTIDPLSGSVTLK